MNFCSHFKIKNNESNQASALPDRGVFRWPTYCWGNVTCLLTGQDFYLEINKNVLEVDNGNCYNMVSILKATQLYT